MDNIIGMVSGRLTAISTYSKTHMNCICECGNDRVVSIRNLKANRSKSCGCSRSINQFNKINLSSMLGLTSGMLTVIGIHGYVKHKLVVLCKCLCGNEKKIVAQSIKFGRTKSCGCNSVVTPFKKGNKHKLTHGLYKSSLYSIWYGILDRCNRVNGINYHNYGGRGIKCEWESFDQFIIDMKESYKEGLTIDRINVDGSYSKSNCRWATIEEQNYNKRNTVRVEIDGQMVSLLKLCRDYGVSYIKVKYRMKKYGWDIKYVLDNIDKKIYFRTKKKNE